MAAFDAIVGATARCVGEAEASQVAVQLWTALHGFVSLRAVLPAEKVFGAWPTAEEFLDRLFDANIAAKTRRD
jgi:hypothetical protein